MISPKIFLNKRVLSWSLYDMANTAFSALIITLFFPVLIKVYLGGNEFQIGLVMGLSLFLSALFVPLVGGVSDALKVKRPFIIVFTLFTIIFTILIAYSNLYFALIFGLLANLFYHGSLDIYDSMLHDIVGEKNYGKVSGLGTAFGYLGTILSLGMAWLILETFGWNSEMGIRFIFPATAAFFVLFSVPIFLFVKDATSKVMSYADGITRSILEVTKTLTDLKTYKNIWIFLIASFIYVDSLNTVIIFLYLFGREEIGLTIKEFFPMFAVMAIGAVIGSLFFGYLSDKISPKKSLVFALTLWIGVIVMLLYETNFITYYIAGVIGGGLLGAIWTCTRPLMIQLSPKHKIAELFGFQGLTEKLGGLIGPVVFGALVVYHSYTAALIFILGMFILGLILLTFVKA